MVFSIVQVDIAILHSPGESTHDPVEGAPSPNLGLKYHAYTYISFFPPQLQPQVPSMAKT